MINKQIIFLRLGLISSRKEIFKLLFISIFFLFKYDYRIIFIININKLALIILLAVNCDIISKLSFYLKNVIKDSIYE